MSRYSWAVLLIAYVAGLLVTGLPIPAAVGMIIFLILGSVLGWIMPYRWRSGPKRRIWGFAAVVGIVAIAHLQLRQPQPSQWDISSWVERASDRVNVTGEILEMPRQNRQGRLRFPLAVERLNQNDNVTGKLYVTIPLLQGTGLVPGHTVTLTGRLYSPQPAQTPGAFDFQDYLRQRGIFAGFSGELAEEPEMPPWGFWVIRQRMTQSLVKGLGSPNGFLVSSMILGRRAVDLPGDVQTQFTQAGLAHTLAASGFHVSLLIGGVIFLVQRCSPSLQLAVGLVTLGFYLLLTGLHPSVVRAAVMGTAGLLTLILNRRVRPMGLLLVTATGLLMINPIWIWDVGFQLSFMATAGLVTTLPWLQEKFSWLPPKLATPVLIPIAVLGWTLPITLTHFHVMPLYGVVVNGLTALPVLVITYGGMICAAIAALSPPLGSLTASLLFFPAELLRTIVAWANTLPWSQWQGGDVALWQLLLMYGGIIGLLYVPKLHSWQRLGIVCGLALILTGPYLYGQWTKVQITVMGAADYPIVIVQDRGQTALLGMGNRATFDYQVQPFLAHSGVNRLQAVVQLDRDPPETQIAIADRYPIETLWTLNDQNPGSAQLLEAAQSFTVGSTTIERISVNPPLLQITRPNQQWLIAPDPLVPVPEQQPRPDVIVARDRPLISTFLTQPDPAIAITVKAESSFLSTTVEESERYVTEDVGAVWWTPQLGLQTGEGAIDPLLE